MRKLSLTSMFMGLAFLLSLGLQAQDRGIPYQAVARDASDGLLANKSITVRFTLLQGGSNIFQEVHTLTTNKFGQFTASIGSNNFGAFNAIDWAPATSLKVELDAGTGIIDMGTTPLESVPYAKTATDMKVSDLKDVSSTAPTNDQVLKWNGTEWAPADAGGSAMGTPIAYGYVNSNGTLSVGSTNIGAITYNTGSGRYEITITGESYFFNTYVTVVTPGGSNISGNWRVSSGSGNMYVYLRDTNNAVKQGDFAFVTYKP